MTFIKRLLIITISWPMLIALNLILLIIGWIVIPVALGINALSNYNLVDMKRLPIWGNRDGIEGWYSGSAYWWYAWRNPVNNLRFLFTEPNFTTIGEDDLESRDGLQWRYRYGGWMDSLRITWGNRDKHKGKNELYLGWKLNGSDVEGTAFTAQLRPVWILLIPVIALLMWGWVT